eukprot:scaffold5072_cov72-Cylindrotheca_fusiformis.AAC.3
MRVFQQSIILNAFQKATVSSDKKKATSSMPAGLSKLDSDEDAYLEWLLEARKKSMNLTVDEQPLLVLHRGMAGMGHQLIRLSSVYHLAMLYKIPRIWPTQNPTCGGTIFSIHEYLLGEGQIMVDLPFLGTNNLYEHTLPFPDSFPTLTYIDEARLLPTQREKLTRHTSLINEIPGYRRFGNLTWLLQKRLYAKDLTDYQLYHQVMLLFEHKHKSRIRYVMNQTRFQDHTVIALHIRTGNGEEGDFDRRGRKMHDMEEWIANVINLLCDYQSNHANYFQRKPLMIYVGTDTGSIIPMLQDVSSQHCRIPIVSAEQAYPEEGKSVSFLYKYPNDESCFKAWENMFLDMYMFTKCNSVMAGSYSSFTQAAPLSFVMHKARRNDVQDGTHPHSFCQLGTYGNRMDCFDDMVDWLKQSPKFLWGDDQAPSQRMRHVISFPRPRKSLVASELKAAFQGTPLMVHPI